MAVFYTSLEVKKIGTTKDARPIWQLTKPLHYGSDVLGGRLIVPRGFQTDCASVPRIPLAYLLTGDTAHEAAVIHDWLYKTNGVTRAQADSVFYEAIVTLGEPRWRAWLMWSAVRAGGWKQWREYRNAESEAGRPNIGVDTTDRPRSNDSRERLPEA